MRWLMRLVVRHGTGGKADAPGYMVGGKTGTADKLRGRRYARDARIASFVGAFPMDRPRYVVFAMVDEPKATKKTFGYATGGWVAAPVVGRVVERMAPLVGVRPRPAAEEEGAERLLLRPGELQGEHVCGSTELLEGTTTTMHSGVAFEELEIRGLSADSRKVAPGLSVRRLARRTAGRPSLHRRRRPTRRGRRAWRPPAPP